jgi:hypothetical protein
MDLFRHSTFFGWIFDIQRDEVMQKMHMWQNQVAMNQMCQETFLRFCWLANFKPYFCGNFLPYGKFCCIKVFILDTVSGFYCIIHFCNCCPLGIPDFDPAFCVYVFCEGAGHYMIVKRQSPILNRCLQTSD